MADLSHLLARIEQGDIGAADELLPLIEDELRDLARRHLRRERGDHVLQTTLLVDEVYLRLIGQRRVTWSGRSHFLAIASRIIRRILVDDTRKRLAAQRGGGMQRLTMQSAEDAAAEDGVDVLALEDALRKLAELDERQAQVVELRFFGGLKVEQVADVLGVSPRTVETDWQMARAWLRRELG